MFFQSFEAQLIVAWFSLKKLISEQNISHFKPYLCDSTLVIFLMEIIT